MALGILAIGGYLPKARLQRLDIAKANDWFNPPLKGLANGERTMANWDEDSVTMAVEGGRDCLTVLIAVLSLEFIWHQPAFHFKTGKMPGLLPMHSICPLKSRPWTSHHRNGPVALPS
ncbi:MAG: hypothetical protein Ct9H300mP14_12580 [Gammaproteobacteria bacterium]|nr:MAG: hypothetical protein Ct9H300mP14_12580 [Gammaproteobacteria bacterium]